MPRPAGGLKLVIEIGLNLRNHLQKFIEAAAGEKVDTLLIEGTQVGPENPEEEAVVRMMGGNPGHKMAGEVELSENEWAKACNLRQRYWLYAVYGCASPRPRLARVQDPFGRQIANPKGGVVIDEKAVLAAAEADG